MESRQQPGFVPQVPAAPEAWVRVNCTAGRPGGLIFSDARTVGMVRLGSEFGGIHR